MLPRLVKDVIRNRSCATVQTGSSVRSVAILMKERQTSAILVVHADDGRFVGICTGRDIVLGIVATACDPNQIKVESIMTSNPLTLSPESLFGHALHLMYEGCFRHIPVIENGRPVGLLCAKDALILEALEFEIELIRREEIMVIL